MTKKLAAAAVACLFTPGTALAQSSVTISGFLKGGFETLKIGDYTTIGAGGRAVGSGRTSQSGVVDDLSRIIFSVREDLGGGLAAIAQLDSRFPVDTGGGALATGNSHVGLQSKSWGRIFVGRQDLHYMYTAGDIDVKNSMRADSKSLLVFAGAINARGAAVNGGTAIAGATRTSNVIHYTTPSWGGFTGIVAYSSNPVAQDGDIGNAASQSIRRGNAWNLNPGYAAANWQVGYSYWRSKPDTGITANLAALATTTPGGIATNYGAADQRSHRIYGNYTFGFGLKIGIAWDNSKLEGNTGTSNNTTLSKRTVWSIPVRYEFGGKHTIVGHYTWAKDDTANVLSGINNSTGANMWAIGYNYDLSKRTAVGITYARINNQANAGYSFFTAGTGGGLGLGNGVFAGEDPRLLATTIRHAF